MTDPANLITFMLKVRFIPTKRMSVKLKDLLSSLKEFTATETRGFIDDGFILDLGINATLDTLYREQDDIYNLGIQLCVLSSQSLHHRPIFQPTSHFTWSSVTRWRV